MDPLTRLSYLDALRGFAIILVVGLHAHGYAFHEGTESLGSFNSIWISISGAAVPIFFFVDGWLTARSQGRIVAPRLDEVARKSIRRLLIPWFIFNIIYVGLRAMFEARGLFPTHLIIGQPIGVVFSNIIRSRIAMQLYFLPALFLIRVAAFPLGRIARRPTFVFVAIWLGYVALDPHGRGEAGYRPDLAGFHRIPVFRLRDAGVSPGTVRHATLARPHRPAGPGRHRPGILRSARTHRSLLV